MHVNKHKKIFKRVAIIGLGLMGASLALALKRAGVAGTVTAFARRAVTRRMALSRRIADAVYASIGQAVKGADVVVLCAPVGVIPKLAKKCRPFLAPHAVMTDVGSVKQCVISNVQKLFCKGDVRFVGSHPIAGSEHHGLESACAGLYRGAVVVVTPTRQSSQKAVKVVVSFWRALGSRVALLSPENHDRLVARTSHLPHAVAALLAGCVGRVDTGRHALLCGSGFRDATRIAEGDPGLWRDIFECNARFLAGELKAFETELKRLRMGLEKGDGRKIGKYLEQGRERRRQLLAKHK